MRGKLEPCFSIRADFGTFLLTAEKIDRDLAALGGQFLFGFNVRRKVHLCVKFQDTSIELSPLILSTKSAVVTPPPLCY